MHIVEPLPLSHSWPLNDRENQFTLGQLDYWAVPYNGRSKAGRWSCNLVDNSLSWSPEVFALFGLPDGAAITRPETVAMYCEESRVAMERLRAYAIRHRRGFTLDAKIRPVRGRERWMRLIAAPVCTDGQVVRLEGLKLYLHE